MRSPEIGAFEMRPGEVGAPEVSSRQIKPPTSLPLAISFRFGAPDDYSKRAGKNPRSHLTAQYISMASALLPARFSREMRSSV
jgi:hypothetical protein